MIRTLIAAFAVFAASAGQAKTYNIDPDHSSVSFKIRHLGSKVAGSFSAVSGNFDYDAKNPKSWSAQAEIDASSIDTHNAKRDAHLKSPDFFDVEKCPKLTFKSTASQLLKGRQSKLTGDLTMHCVTKPVTLTIEVSKPESDPWGNMRVGATAKVLINRKDFGIVWNKALDKGGLMLGEEVEVELGVEGVEPKK